MPDREDLHFGELVEQHFQFLQMHGFRCELSEPSFVRFASKQTFVNIYHGRLSYEIGLELGSFVDSVNDNSYSMAEIIRLVESNEKNDYRNYAAHTFENVAEGVKTLAVHFRKYVDAGVLSDASLFERLQKNREKWSREYATEMDLYHARQLLADAWHSKDYKRVVELLKPLRDLLTSSEVHKLEYAEKHKRET